LAEQVNSGLHFPHTTYYLLYTGLPKTLKMETAVFAETENSTFDMAHPI
jgi:hypothetical protein